MDAGNETIREEKRKERAKQVSIKFIDDYFQHFDVVAPEDEFDKKNPELLKWKKGDKKYLGIIIGRNPHQSDFCTCPSFYFGNSDEYKKAHLAAFQCKHLIEARELRFCDYP